MQSRTRGKPVASDSTSFPLWVITLLMLLVGMCILMFVIALVPDEINGIRHANLFIISAVMIVETLLFVFILQRMVSSRIRALSYLLSEDILIVAGDPATFECLSKLPVLAVSEVNMLQLAIEHLYFGCSVDLRRRGVLPLVSRGGATTGGEAEISVWREEDAEEPSVHDYRLDEYLLSRSYRYRQKLNNVLQIPAETGARASTFVRGLLRSVSGQLDAMPVDRDYLDSDHFIETDRRRRHSATLRSTQSRKASLYSAISISSFDDNLLSRENERSEVDFSNEHSISIIPLTTDEYEECDPLRDNINNDFGVLSSALTLESSIIFQVIKTIRVGRSLTSVTLPVHILESRSLLEMLSDMFVSWELLLPVATGHVKDPVERLRVVLQWFFAAYHWRPRAGAKKPYNPILGEVFLCKCPASKEFESSYLPTVDVENLETLNSTSQPCSPPTEKVIKESSHMRFIAEQVSHRPPVSVFHAEVPELIIAHGAYLPRSKLVSLNCAAGITYASVQLRFPRAKCEYILTLPDAYATGVIAGKPRLELGGVVRIEDRHSPAHATVDFLRKGFFGGQYDEVVATISRADGAGRAEEFRGVWHGTLLPSASDPAAPGEPLFDATAYQRRRGLRCGRPQAFPVPGGHTKQSRAVWRELTAAIRHQDAEAAAKAKVAVEEGQRAERKRMQAEEKVHAPKFFQYVGTGNIATGNETALGRFENWCFTSRDVLFKETADGLS